VLDVFDRLSFSRPSCPTEAPRMRRGQFVLKFFFGASHPHPLEEPHPSYACAVVNLSLCSFQAQLIHTLPTHAQWPFNVFDFRFRRSSSTPSRSSTRTSCMLIAQRSIYSLQTLTEASREHPCLRSSGVNLFFPRSLKAPHESTHAQCLIYSNVSFRHSSSTPFKSSTRIHAYAVLNLFLCSFLAQLIHTLQKLHTNPRMRSA
jgi:hypothetical protein